MTASTDKCRGLTTSAARPAPAPGLAQSFLAGCIASCGAVALTNPFDVIRTRLELQGELARGGARLYKGAVHGLYRMVADEGLEVLWRGLKPAVAYQIAVNGTRLGVYARLKQWLLDHSDVHGMDQWLTSLVAGAAAGMLGAAVGTPLQLVKTRMQAATCGAAVTAAEVSARRVPDSLAQALAHTMRSEGVLGLYRGAHLNIMKLVVASAVQLAVFDGMVARLQQREGWGQKHPTAALMVAAMAAGLAVTAVVQPVDVVTTRLWNQPVLNGAPTLYRNAWECAAKAVVSEGPQALYKGCTAHLLRVGPHTVLTLLLLDRVQRALQHQGPQKGGQTGGAGRSTAPP